MDFYEVPGPGCVHSTIQGEKYESLSCGQICQKRKRPSKIHSIDPLGQPTITAGRDNCFRVCSPSVRLHFSKSSQTKNKPKHCSLLARLWVWPSGSLMTLVLYFTVLDAWAKSSKQDKFVHCHHQAYCM